MWRACCKFALKLWGYRARGVVGKRPEWFSAEE